MTQSMQFLRQFMRAFQQEAASTRIFFPDNKARLGREAEGLSWWSVTAHRSAGMPPTG